MGVLTDIVEGVAAAFRSAATAAPSCPGGGAAVEACCSQLGWGIDERPAAGVYVLHFRDPAAGVRKVTVVAGDSSRAAVFAASSAARPRELPPGVMAYLLRRNAEIFPAWQVSENDDGSLALSVGQGVFTRGMDAAVFKAVCEALVGEAADFDAKLRQSGPI